MPTQKLTTEIIIAAIEGFESQKTRIDQQIAELRSLLTGGSAETAATPEPAKRKRRKMSAAGRRAIAEAQRKRWAASKKPAESLAPEAPPKPKRKLSAPGKAAIVAATKRRWEAVRAAKAQQEKAATKKPAKKAAVKKGAKKNVPVRKAAVKKSAAKKTAPVAAQSVTETGGQ